MQNQDYLVDVEVIEDREYNENDIMELYEDALRKVIEKAEKEYNTAPFLPISPEDILIFAKKLKYMTIEFENIKSETMKI